MYTTTPQATFHHINFLANYLIDLCIVEYNIGCGNHQRRIQDLFHQGMKYFYEGQSIINFLPLGQNRQKGSIGKKNILSRISSGAFFTCLKSTGIYAPYASTLYTPPVTMAFHLYNNKLVSFINFLHFLQHIDENIWIQIIFSIVFSFMILEKDYLVYLKLKFSKNHTVKF